VRPAPIPGTRPGLSSSRWREWFIRALLVVFSTLIVLAAGEVIVRLEQHRLFSLQSSRRETMFLLRSAFPARYDSRLGYVPQEGFSGPVKVWGGTWLSIDEDGFRRNGRRPPPSGRCVLTVGDSYTFGDEVSDEETWPAHLERRLGRRVLNAGVFGYGFDQIALRAQDILKVRPCVDTLVVGLIADDVGRCEYSYRFAWKPYFGIVNGALVLKNVPVPQGKAREHWVLGALGYSYLADSLFRRFAPHFWLVPSFDVRRVHAQGQEVAVLLLDRLASLARSSHVRLILLVQGHPGHDRAPLATLLNRARGLDVEVVDVHEQLIRLAGVQPELQTRFFKRGTWGHMTSEGNGWVAERIVEQLRKSSPPISAAPKDSSGPRVGTPAWSGGRASSPSRLSCLPCRSPLA
jgi:hypothetical protein